MTISVTDSESSIIDHDGVQAVYNYTFQEADATNIEVYIKPPAPAAEVKLTNPTHFTAAVDSDGIGGQITLVSPATYPNGSKMRIARETPLVQPSRFSNTGSSYPEAFEAALDKLTRVVQELSDDAARALARTITEQEGYDAGTHPISNVVDPTNAQDAATKAYADALIAALPTISAWGETLIDDADGDAGLLTLGLTAYTIALAKEANLVDYLDEMGISADVSTLLQQSSGANFLLSLGFTAYTQTLIPAADSEAFRDLIEVDEPNPNLLANGDFQIRQWGDSFTSTVPVAGANDNGEYTADQWVLLSELNDAVDVSFSTRVTGDGVNGMSSIILDATATKGEFGICQILDNRESVVLRSKNIQASFAARQIDAGGVDSLRITVLSWDGTPDAAGVINPIQNWNSDAPHTYKAGWVSEGTTTVSLTTDWQTVTLGAGLMDLPADCENVAFLITTNDADSEWASGDSIEITDCKLEQGTKSTKFYPKRYAEELTIAERFFEKTFQMSLAPADGLASLPGALVASGATRGALGTGSVSFDWRFSTRKRATPIITTYTPEAGTTAGFAQSSTSSAEVAVGATPAGESGVALISAAGPGAGLEDEHFTIHATADARLK